MRYLQGAVAVAVLALLIIACSGPGAERVPEMYSLKLEVSGEGAVSVLPDKPEYAEGDEVEVTAVPAPGWLFSHWEGDLEGTKNPATLEVNGDLNVTAIFIEVRHSLDVVVSGQGVVDFDPNQTDYEHGQSVELIAVPAPGWLFSHWEGDLTGTANPVTLEIDGDTSIAAVFTAGQHVLGVEVNGEGSVTRSPDQAEYSFGSEVTLTAAPLHGGWAFSHWEGDLEGTKNPATLEVNGDLNVTAIFIEVRHSLDVVVSGQGVVDFDPNQTDYEHGQSVELIAVPARGWLFSHWEGDLTGSSNPASVEMDGDKSVSAVFTPEQHVVTTAVTGQGTVARNPEQAEYSYGSEVALTAVPRDRGWVFSHWEGDVIGIANPIAVEVDGDKSVTAVFTEVPHTLDVSVSGQGTVNVDPDQPEYTYGEEVEVTAIPAAGWLFSHWEGELTGATNPATVAVIGETEVTAQFTSILGGLVSSFYNSVTINNRVHGMALSLRSTLPEAVNIHRVEVQRPNGTLFAFTEDPSILGVLNPGASIGLSVSPAIAPLLSEVRSFTVHWYGTHDGLNFERIGNFTGF